MFVYIVLIGIIFLVIYILFMSINRAAKNIVAGMFFKEAEKAIDKGDYLKAIKKLEKAKVSNPTNADIYYKLGGLYANLKNYEKALEYTKLSLKYDNQSGYPHFNLVLLYKKLGKNNEFKTSAKEYLKCFGKIYPTDAKQIEKLLKEVRYAEKEENTFSIKRNEK